MELIRLYDTQQELDAHILDNHEELKGQDNLDWKVLALQVELGECANEWRGFKKWSNDRKPRTKNKCIACHGVGEVRQPIEGYFMTCPRCDGSGREDNHNPLLEEYVDCLHFILSIGLELNFIVEEIDVQPHSDNDIIDAFTSLITGVGILRYQTENIENSYKDILAGFIQLGWMLGYTWEQVEQAYFEKNKVNHERQEVGY
ncbi:dUTP diphosphatase [Lysinibacillus odysseyi]|uniref:dUTPase n=1 Tax=Lysinibacillus odysseyi 34hs-1 = NBRC 100172 TaxID=1220589 RepID=A0A0A3IVA0_9BACI|nr:dUTP diphosphatase [Lysinibacillus odysseyi]KGR88709.1 hypothetical protein CD32_01190 [Lysinibacillus odysseyi 34hs-1 = NBRC 100172]